MEGIRHAAVAKFKQLQQLNFSSYYSCYSTPVQPGEDGCYQPYPDQAIKDCQVSHYVTDPVACIHGFMNAWRHWCQSDEKVCVAHITSNSPVFSGVLLVRLLSVICW